MNEDNGLPHDSGLMSPGADSGFIWGRGAYWGAYPRGANSSEYNPNEWDNPQNSLAYITKTREEKINLKSYLLSLHLNPPLQKPNQLRIYSLAVNTYFEELNGFLHYLPDPSFRKACETNIKKYQNTFTNNYIFTYIIMKNKSHTLFKTGSVFAVPGSLMW